MAIITTSHCSGPGFVRKERGDPFHSSSRGGEERPAQDDPENDRARSPSIAEPAAGNFEQHVASNERGEDPAHALGRAILGAVWLAPGRRLPGRVPEGIARPRR